LVCTCMAQQLSRVGSRQTGFNGSLTPAQRKALLALKEALLAFALDNIEDGEEQNPDLTQPGDPVRPGTLREEAEEAELLADSRTGLLRLLRTSDFDVRKARDLAVTCCKWRASVKPWSIGPELIPVALPSGMWRFGGHTKAGMPIVLVDVAKWAPADYRYGLDEYIRYVAYFMEGAIGRMGPGVEQICMICSMAGWTSEMMQPLAVRCASKLLYIWQNIYPERMGAIFLCNATQAFQGYFFRILRPWMSHRFLSNIHFVGSNLRETLFKHIDPSQLPAHIGLTPVGGTHEEHDVPWRSVPDELDAFIADLGGVDCLPSASDGLNAITMPCSTEIKGDASATNTGDIDLLIGKTQILEVMLFENTLTIDWHITGDLHGVVFGYKVCSPGILGQRIHKEGSLDVADGACSPASAGCITGTLDLVGHKWAGCKLQLTLYNSYSRSDCKTLAFSVGVEAK